MYSEKVFVPIQYTQCNKYLSLPVLLEFILIQSEFRLILYALKILRGNFCRILQIRSFNVRPVCDIEHI